MTKILRFFENCSRPRLVLIIWFFAIGVGALDYFTGYEIAFSFFYLGAIALAAWFIDWRFAVLISIASSSLSFISDILAGAAGRRLFLSAWNTFLALGFYIVVVWILTALRSLQNQLEQKVRDRTAALTAEMKKREALEKEILAVSDREQQRIGHDLHDSLCQHLTATAIAGEVLREKLEGQGRGEAADARQIVTLVEEGITMARGLARGLAPVEFEEEEGLMAAFSQFARSISERFHIQCTFLCADPVPIHDGGVAIHLFRIAQEAVTNAIRHGHSRNVKIALVGEPGLTRLTVRDDGCGIPEGLQKTPGMGLHIMRHRAKMIEAELDIYPAKPGTIVECTLRKDEETLP